MVGVEPKLKQVTPIVPVEDLRKSLRFFCDTLGFSSQFETDDYVFIFRDGVGIRLVKAEAGVDTHDPARQLACYIDVENLDALYVQLKPGLDRLPPGRVRAPFDQPYGQREFHVIDEDSLLIFFGESIRE